MKLVEKQRYDYDCCIQVLYDIYLDDIEIGCASIMEYDDGIYIERLDIDEPYRNKGYGTAAVEIISDMYDAFDIYAAPENARSERFWADHVGGEEVSGFSDYGAFSQGYGVYKF